MSNGTLRLQVLFTLLPLKLSCQDPPAPPVPKPKPAVIVAEPARSVDPRDLRRCDFDPPPMLLISPTLVLLDGVAVDESQLESVLNSKQDLYALLGAPPHTDLVVQIAKGVPEKRVAPFVTKARAAGFINITRFPDIESPQTPRQKPHTSP
jgi:hypothetical protein